MRNPLNKRFPREIKNNLGKYLGMFLMMVFATSFTSGFLLAASSIEKIVGAMPETYAIEDGRFTCDFEAEDDAIGAVEALNVTVMRDFYNEEPLDLGNSGDGASNITVRIYPPREVVNIPNYAQGRAPEADNEIALDRVFMQENHGLAIGDKVLINGKEFTICGALTYPDYQALFQDNSSFMFDALTFCVAAVSQQAYQDLSPGNEVYNYSYTFNDSTLDLAARTDIEKDMLDALSDHNAFVNNLIDAQDNQGIGYALDDVQGDQTMWTVLLFILVVIMAFVFVVLTDATIESESSVIGTMLASGWRKREIIAHYMVLPAIIGALGSAIGLILGVNLLTDSMKSLYYHSYSIPPYYTIWDWKVVFITAVVPFLLLVSITLFGLARKMRFTPLQYLRHEAVTRKRRSSLPLPDGLRYPTRFRLRVLLRNLSHFVTLFFGILFASLLLLFGTCMLPVVQNYAGELVKTIAAPHQYVLKAPLELNGSDSDREMYAAALRLVEDKGRYEANKEAIDAAKRLKENTALMDALDRLQNQDELMEAIERLESNQDFLEAAERLEGNQPVVYAAQRLAEKQAIVEAIERLQSKQPLVEAVERLQNKGNLVRWVQWSQQHPDIVAAAQRVAAGSADPADLALVTTLTDEEKAGLQMLATMDEQTKADLELMNQMDDQTKADMELARNVDEQTRADLELLSNLDAQTKNDLELMQNMSEQTQRDLERVQNMSEQTRADIELVSGVDEATQADIDLVETMDEDLLNDVRLAADIDTDAHIVNTQKNSDSALAQVEKFAVGSLEIERAMGGKMESVTVYGISPDSAYWTDIPVKDGHIVAGRGLIEKTKAATGEEVEAHNRRTGKTYSIAIAESASNEANTNLYMTLDDFNVLFDNDADYFNAYASAEELNLDTRYTAQHIQPSDMLKMADQLETSMGKIMYMMMAMAVPIYLILVYLLTKTVIDRSARSISYMKVFGYRNNEVNGLYVRPITYWVLLSLIASLPLIVFLLTTLLRVVFMDYAGNFSIIIPPERFAILVLVGMFAYAIVAFLHVRRIKKVPLELAMKVQE